MIIDLSGFHGTENWYRHSINRNFLYTDGVRYLAAEGGAYWLVDEIAFASVPLLKNGNEFQEWHFNRTGSSGVLTAEDGNNHILYTQHIPFTDFPLDKIKFYAVWDGSSMVLMLPSEY